MNRKKTPASIKRSITLPVDIHNFVESKAAEIAKLRGNHAPNFSAVLTDLIIAARAAAAAVKR